MRRNLLLLIGVLLLFSLRGMAQDLHFSQFYNQPMLFNPSLTGHMPDADYRLAAQYRSQWQNLPVPYKTIAAAGDVKLLAHEAKRNWLGLGLGFYNDKAGHGDLSLTKAQVSAAYHLEFGRSSILSVGIGFAVTQRSVNMSKLTFDNQWNGLKFDSDLPHREGFSNEKTSYLDASLGLSYAYAPSEFFFVQMAAGLMHVNQPKESFYNGDNKIAFRPVVDLKSIILIADEWIAEVGVQASQQKTAFELIGGGQVYTNVTPRSYNANVLIMGAYYRLYDAVIPTFGYEWNGIRLLISSDIPLGPNNLGPAMKYYGGVEVSLIYKGLYDGGRSRGSVRKAYGCPRF